MSDDFDLEGWISSAKLPERSVALCARGDLLADHKQADERLRALRPAQDLMMGEADPRRAAAQVVRDLEDQIEAATRTFRVRALTAAEQDKIRGESAKDKKGEVEFGDFSARWLAVSTVSPTLTVEQVRRLRDALGEGQYLDWFNTSSQATNDRVSVPFSPAASAALRTPES